VRTVAPPIQVSSASSAVGGNVGASTVLDTPLNGRDWAQLATCRRASPVSDRKCHRRRQHRRGFGAAIRFPERVLIRIAIARWSQHNDYSNGAPGSVLGIIWESTLWSRCRVGSNYPASTGELQEASLMRDRPGKNAFHGTCIVLCNSALDARNFFDAPKFLLQAQSVRGLGGLPIRKGRHVRIWRLRGPSHSRWA